MPCSLLLSRRAQIVAATALACLLACIAAPTARADEVTTAAQPAQPSKAATDAKPDANAPIYVGAHSVDHEFQFVTEECMQIIRSKRILFGSRSWGLGLGTIMARKDKKYELAWESFASERVNDTNRVLKPDVFDKPKIVHYVFDMVPRRWAFMDDYLRKDPWKFGDKIDGAFQSLYCGPKKEAQQMADEYFPMLDKLVKDFPNVRFAILTHPVSGSGPDMKGKDKPAESDWNIGGGQYSDEIVRRYYGKLPILDFRDIVSTHADGTPCTFEYEGKTYRKLCPEYNVKGGDLIHPNTPEARDRMAKGFILLLAKMYCADKMPPMNTPKPEILKEPAPAGTAPGTDAPAK